MHAGDRSDLGRSVTGPTVATATEIQIRTDQLDSLGGGRIRDLIVVEIHRRVRELPPRRVNRGQRHAAGGWSGQGCCTEHRKNQMNGVEDQVVLHGNGTGALSATRTLR